MGDEILCQVALFVSDLLSLSLVLRNPMLCGILDEPVRNPNYYEEVIPAYSLDEFRLHFRMSRTCFSDLMLKIGNIERIDHLEKKFLFSAWMFTKQESFLSAGDRFNFSKSSAHRVFCTILDVLCSLLTEYVKWPSRSTCPEISRIFKVKSGGYIPGIIGAIDGCHIQIKQPTRNPIDYYNRKNTHSIILLGVCDHRAVFINVYVGASGRLHDARVFRNSRLSQKLEELLPSQFHLLGDAAYPSLQNLVTPFRDNGHLTEQQSHFNTSISVTATIERTLGLLKGRFRRLKYVDVSNATIASKIVVASVILHNHIHLVGDDVSFEEESLTGSN